MYTDSNEIWFSIQQEEKLKEYINEDWFKELNNKVNIYDEEASIDNKIIHVMKYILQYCMSYGDDKEEAIYNFFDLLEHYKTKTYRESIRNEKGAIQLNKSGFNSGNAFYTGKIKIVKVGSGKGSYVNGLYISTDRKEYIKKFSMDARGRMQNYSHHEQSRYNGIIAHEVFEYFEEESANYLPGVTKPPYYYLITENFLNDNQELIPLEDFYLTKPESEYRYHSEILELIKNNLSMRYKNNMMKDDYNNLINKLKLQYTKQAFLKRIISLKDEKLGNIAIILTTNGNESEIPEINISPAYDLDLSFNLAEESQMKQIQTDNGKTDIKSMIEEFAYIQGFKEFIEGVVAKIQDEDLAIESILKNSYQTSKAEFFSDEDNRKDYSDFLKAKFRETKQSYNEIYIKSYNKGEEEDARTLLD